MLSRMANCLEHLLEKLRAAHDFRVSRWFSLTTLAMVSNRDPEKANEMAVSDVWKRRAQSILSKVIELLWVSVIYLMSELIIWGVSRLLAPAGIEFFSSILGMAIVFAIMVVFGLCFRCCNRWYQKWVKSKVDFINAHLAVGFPVPLIMLDQSQMLNGHDIARIVGNFVVTNLVSWPLSFMLAFGVMVATARLRPQISKKFRASRLSRYFTSNQTSYSVSSLTDQEEARREKNGIREETTSSQRTSLECMPLPTADRSIQWSRAARYYPIFLSLFCALAIGAPVAAVTHDSRVLDGCVLWFIWITSVRSQRFFKQSRLCLACPRLKNALATLMNPVLVTTLIMTGYTRVKAAAIAGIDLAQVLHDFSRGTPLYNLWTSGVTGMPLPNNRTRFFGPGDAALSLLEVGILIWGFKLYECRHQLFSIAGLITVILSIAGAAGNAFLSVGSARLMGLDAPEALAFAARSATLALAKPAIGAVGGNLVVNAAVVVSNGILGQLMYPFALSKIGVRSDEDTVPLEPTQRPDSQELRQSMMSQKGEKKPATSDDDDVVTIAAGIAIGINGVAMGVAYLYETKSRAAPYAALSMTICGVMTVVFSTVEPFKSSMIALAGS